MKNENVAKWFADEDNLRAFRKELKELTWINYHTERLIVVAEKFGFEDFERKFKNIDAVHTDAGCLFPDLSQWRWRLADAMYKEIERLYGEELASEIRNA